MWISILALVPEKRLTGTFNVLVFLSIALPVLAGISAFAAWRLNDRINRLRPAPQNANTPAPALASVQQKQLGQKQREPDNALHEAEVALQRSKEEPAQAERAAKTAVAHASDRKVTSSQRKRF